MDGIAERIHVFVCLFFNKKEEQGTQILRCLFYLVNACIHR